MTSTYRSGWKDCLFFVIFLLILSLASCADLKSVGAQKWPLLPYVIPTQEIVVNAEQRAAITRVIQQEPSAYALVHTQLERYKAQAKQSEVIQRDYTRAAIEVNRNQLIELLHYSKAEAGGLIANQLRDLGYPADVIKGLIQ